VCLWLLTENLLWKEKNHLIFLVMDKDLKESKLEWWENHKLNGLVVKLEWWKYLTFYYLVLSFQDLPKWLKNGLKTDNQNKIKKNHLPLKWLLIEDSVFKNVQVTPILVYQELLPCQMPWMLWQRVNL